MSWPYCSARPASDGCWSAAILRQTGVTTAAHVAAFNLGLKSISVDRRRHRDRETRLLVIAQGLIAAAEIGIKEHDRVALAKTIMEQKLEGRRTSSKLPKLIELVMARPLVSAGMGHPVGSYRRRWRKHMTPTHPACEVLQFLRPCGHLDEHPRLTFRRSKVETNILLDWEVA